MPGWFELSRVGGAIIVAAVALALTMPAAAETTIRIGSSLSLTGPASGLGEPQARTLRMYVDRINAGGGVIGRDIALAIYDDEGDAGLARTFAERLIDDDGVVAVIGGTASATATAMVPAFEAARIPFVALAGAEVVVEPVREWVFTTSHSGRLACRKIFENMRAQGISVAGMISGPGGFDSTMRTRCLDVAPDYGVEVVADEGFGPDDTDVTPQLTAIGATSGVEAVIHPGVGHRAAIVTREFAALGLKVPLYQSHRAASWHFIELAEEAAERVRMPAPLLLVADHLDRDDPRHAVITAYRDAYESEFGEYASSFGGYALDGLMLLVDAIERAESADPTAIRDALEATRGFVGVTGTFNMSPQDHMGLGMDSLRMVEIRGRAFVPID